MRKVFQLNTELFKVTGIQRVLMDVHEALKDEFDAKIVGTAPFKKIPESLGVRKEDYLEFHGFRMFRNSVVIIHERRFLPKFWIWNKLFGLNAKVIYVHHNQLYGQKLLSRFPKNVVAISDAGIKNLHDYFGVPLKNITKIHNCVKEKADKISRERIFDPNNIQILYPARINGVKRQIEIVNELKGKLDSRIKILFAGEGPMLEDLKTLCTGSDQFQALGFRNDIPELMKKCDFMMLNSKTEGLPISLIEGAQNSLPLICNNVGGNFEIAQKGKNLIDVSDWNRFAEILNNLTKLIKEEYDSLSRNSREIYEKYYTFDVFKSNYSNLVRKLV